MKQPKTHDVKTKLVTNDKDWRTSTDIYFERSARKTVALSWHKLQIIAQEDDDPQNDQRNSRKDR